MTNSLLDTVTERKNLKSIIIIAICCLYFFYPPKNSFGENSYLLDRALSSIGARSDFLSIPPDLYDCPFTPSKFKRWVKLPLKAPLEAQIISRRLLKNCKNPTKFVKEALSIDKSILPKEVSIDFENTIYIPEDIPHPLRYALTLLLSCISRANRDLRELISEDEKKEIVKYLYPVNTHAQEPILNEKLLINAIQKAGDFKISTLLSCAVYITKAMEDSIKILTSDDSWYSKVRTRCIATPLGNVIIGGTGNDRHTENAILIIELGGNDTYEGMIASGSDSRCSIVIDISGNDTYKGGNLSLGAGFFGIGLLIDLAGHDIYMGGDISLGAGFFGTGVLMDLSGDDHYTGEHFTQSASMFGAGILLDLEGNDLYVCSGKGQAYSSTSGISCLTDQEGNDTFIARGDEPDPREKDIGQSLSQGFSIGLREIAGGGLAFLINGYGNDTYICEYFGQGSSYWTGIGVLYDEQGKDTYIARRYAQGAGIHYSIGLILDNQGNDKTISWGVSQGCGHDYGIGILVNGTGNDIYSSDWLSMGASEANGLGIFVDNDGDDGYELRASGMGEGRFIRKRKKGGFGIFIDADGRDRYSRKGDNNTIWTDNAWACGIDMETGGASGISLLPAMSKLKVPVSFREKIKKERLRLLGLLKKAESSQAQEKLRYLISVASHWGVERGIPEKAMDELSNISPELSVPFMVKRIGTHDISELLLIINFLMIHPDRAIPQLINLIESSNDSRTISRAIYILSRIKDPLMVEFLGKYTSSKDPGIRSTSIRAIGEILNKSRIKVLKEIYSIIEGCRDTNCITNEIKDRKIKEEFISICARTTSLNLTEYEDFLTHEEGKSKKVMDKLLKTITKKRNFLLDILKQWISTIENPPIGAEKLKVHLDDEELSVKCATSVALGQMRWWPAISLLIPLLESEHLYLRDSSMYALSLFGDEIIYALKKEMENRGKDFKIISLELLGRLNSKKAYNLAMEYINSPDPDIKRASERAISRLRQFKTK